MENWSNKTLLNNIGKNSRAISTTNADILLSVTDCDIEEASKQALMLISQVTGLNQMIFEAEKRGIERRGQWD